MPVKFEAVPENWRAGAGTCGQQRLVSPPVDQAADDACMGSGDSERSALTAGTISFGMTIPVCDLSPRGSLDLRRQLVVRLSFVVLKDVADALFVQPGGYLSAVSLIAVSSAPAAEGTNGVAGQLVGSDDEHTVRLWISHVHYQQVEPSERLSGGEARVASPRHVFGRGCHGVLDLPLTHTMPVDVGVPVSASM